eukprot:m.67949 g.67949  ORF g.67949 m.67949 type:complete len:222 (+) comp12739_c0_seq1:68-733(+)
MPPGHVLIHEKYAQSAVETALRAGTLSIFSSSAAHSAVEGLNVTVYREGPVVWDIACGQGGRYGLILLGEDDLLAPNCEGLLLRRVNALVDSRKHAAVVVLAVVGDSSRPMMPALSTRLVVTFRVCLLPFDTLVDCMKQVKTLHAQDMTDQSPLRQPVGEGQESILRLVQLLPAIGEKRAPALLAQLGSLAGLANASPATLADHVGAAAPRLEQFFNGPLV